MPLTHKTALVTGASSGIGRAISTQLLNAGATVLGLFLRVFSVFRDLIVSSYCVGKASLSKN